MKEEHIALFSIVHSDGAFALNPHKEGFTPIAPNPHQKGLTPSTPFPTLSCGLLTREGAGQCLHKLFFGFF